MGSWGCLAPIGKSPLVRKYVPGTVLPPKETAVIKVDRVLCPPTYIMVGDSFYISAERNTTLESLAS